MAIILDEENNVVTVENQPEAKRTLFKNISDGNGGAIDEILERLDRIYPGTNSGFISSTGAVQSATADAEVYTDEFPVTPGNKVSVTLKYTQDRSMWLAYCLYDESHAFISRTMLVNSVTQKAASVSFTAPEGAYYCRLTYRSFNDATITIDTTGQRLFDVQVAGSSVVINGVAFIPIGGTATYGVFRLATSSETKAGISSQRVISPSRQDMAAFYGIAKAAGDTTQAASDNAVGNYTAEAKIAIQKMLGIYEAPWEIINEGTFTNETEAEYIINTDSNSNSFELTDAIIILWIPTQENAAVIGDYGNVYFWQNNANIRTAYLAGGSSKTIPANSAENVAIARISQSNGLMAVEYYEWAATSAHQAAKRTLVSGADTGGTPFGIKSANIDTIRIGSFTGTMNYRLIGRRKW